MTTNLLSRIDAAIADAQVTGQCSNASKLFRQALAEGLGVEVAPAVCNLLDLLRWHKRFEEGVSLAEAMADAMPDEGFHEYAITLELEAGRTEEALDKLRFRAVASGSMSDWYLLATSYRWCGRDSEALSAFQRVMDGAGDPDLRVDAAWGMFEVHGNRRQLDLAVTAWEAANAIDPTRDPRRDRLIRLLIFWYHYDEAAAMLQAEQHPVRREFLSSLIDFRTAPASERSIWDWVVSLDAEAIVGAELEVAEAALRALRPARVLEILAAPIERGDFESRSLILAGLAWAQQRKLERALWALEVALRQADIERPRRTRPGYGNGRILDTEARFLYGEVVIDSDLRVFLDPYFMPRPHVKDASVTQSHGRSGAAQMAAVNAGGVSTRH